MPWLQPLFLEPIEAFVHISAALEPIEAFWNPSMLPQRSANFRRNISPSLVGGIAEPTNWLLRSARSLVIILSGLTLERDDIVSAAMRAPEDDDWALLSDLQMSDIN